MSLVVRLFATVLIGILCNFAAPVAQANFEELISSTHLGGNPYLLVLHDPQGSSQRAPGIYVRVGSDWQMAVEGRFLPVPIRGGLSHQLQMTKVTNRFESIAVVDGKLTLFTVKSRPELADTFGVVGRGSFEVIDPIDQTPVEIPLIDDLKDVSIHTVEPSLTGASYQILIVSIRKNSVKGDGITFAMALNSADNKGPDVTLAYKPVLLDWKFSDVHQLSERFIVNRGFASLNAISFYARERAQDPIPLKNWRELLRRVLDGRSSLANLTSVERKVYPYIQFATGQIEIDTLPYVTLQNRNHNAISVFDPISRRHGIYGGRDTLSASQFEVVQPHITGAINCTSDSCVDVESLRLPSRAMNMLRLSDGRIYGMGTTVPDDVIDTVLIKPTNIRYIGQKPDQVSWYVMADSSFLLVSWRFGTEAFTSVYEVLNSHNSIRVNRSAEVSRKFFTAEQLKERSSSYGPGTSLFDDFTPVQDDQTYKSLHRETAPHVNVTETLTEGALRYIFPAPLETRDLGSDLEYRLYEAHQGFYQQTGIYVGSKHQAKVVTKTEILHPSVIQNEDGVLDRSTTQINNGGAIELKFFLADSTYKHGKSSNLASVLAIATTNPTLNSTANQFFSRDKIDVEKLKYFRLVRPQGAPAQGNPFDSAQGDAPQPYLAVMGVQGGPTFVISFKIQKSRDGSLSFVNMTESTLGQNLIGVDEVMSRLRFDERNQPYWVETPELEETDNSYRLTKIQDGSGIEPNRSNLRMLFRGVADPSNTGQPVRRVANSWRLGSQDKHYQETLSRIRHASEYQTDVFPEFRQILDDLANPAKPARHIVLVVPPELKSYAENYPLALRVRDEGRPAHWSENYNGFHLYQVDNSRADQEQVLANLNNMKEESEYSRGVRAVLYSPISTVKLVARPKLVSLNGETVGFRIGEQRLSHQAVGIAGSASRTSISSEIREAPVLSYLVATEGRPMDLATFRDHPPTPGFSSIFIGTQDEWNGLLSEAGLEQQYGLADRFEVIRLAPPTREVRESYVLNLLRRPEVRNLGYHIGLENVAQGVSRPNMTTEGLEVQVAQYLVNRAESLSSRNHVPVFDGFMKVLNLFGYELSNNAAIRSGRVIDRGVIEAILSKVFSMPLNINLLPAKDPLKILHRHEVGQLPGEEAAFQWVQAGYYGPLNLKMEIIQTILNQLTSDDVRSVASAMIIYGETGSGKTWLIQTLFKVLGVKTYNFQGTQETNAQAWAFFLPMRKVYDDGPGSPNTAKSPDMMSLSEALTHLDRFLSSPHGYRGFIVLDDIHLAPPNVKARFLSRVRGLLENPTYIATDYNGKAAEFPTRNLTPIFTMNPTDNRERIAKFTERGKEPTDLDVIAATLSTNDGSNDEIRSLLGRFTRIVNLSKFPAEAKAPKLTVTIRHAMQDILENDGRSAVISPAAIQTMVSAFPQMDARNFLSTATRSLTQPIKNYPGSLFAVVPYHRAELQQMAEGPDADGAATNNYGASGVSASSDVEAFARRRIQVLPVDAEGAYRGRIEYLKYILDNFRKHAFELALLGLNHDARFSMGARAQQYLSAPFAQALHRHLLTVPSIPLDQLILEPRDFGVRNNNERDQFRRTLDSEIMDQRASQLPLPAIGLTTPQNLFAIFSGTGGSVQSLTRQHVMKDYTDRLALILEQNLKEVLYLQNLSQMPDAETWLRGLPNRDPQLVETLGSAIMDQLGQFLRDINNRALFENRNQTEETRLSQYDAMRLFVMVFDKAIGRLPWSRVSHFLVDAQSKATRNIALGQSPGVQHFMFDSRTSPLISFDVSLVLMLAQSMPFFNDKSEEQQHSRFMSNCERLLGGKVNP